MKNSYRNVLVKIKEAEQKISWDSRNVIQESMKMAFLLKDLLTETRESVMRDGFLDETDEIEFFRKIKPEILGKLLYYNKVFRIETSCPVCRGSIYQHYFSTELEKLEQNYKEHIGNSEFYRYYRSGNKDQDTVFFVRGNINLNNGLHSYIFEADLSFSTYYDHKVSRIIESDLLSEYLLLKVNEGMDYGILALEPGSEQMCWTESKNALIELIYALHATQCITNGQVGIRKVALLFQNIFNVQLGDVHHAFHRMKDRSGNRSIFLERMKSSLELYMDKDLI